MPVALSKPLRTCHLPASLYLLMQTMPLLPGDVALPTYTYIHPCNAWLLQYKQYNLLNVLKS
jgi:hypothetical protein